MPAWAAAALVVVALLGYVLHRGLLVWTNVALAYGHNDTSLHYYKHCHYLFPPASSMKMVRNAALVETQLESFGSSAKAVIQRPD